MISGLQKLLLPSRTESLHRSGPVQPGSHAPSCSRSEWEPTHEEEPVLPPSHSLYMSLSNCYIRLTQSAKDIHTLRDKQQAPNLPNSPVALAGPPISSFRRNSPSCRLLRVSIWLSANITTRFCLYHDDHHAGEPRRRLAPLHGLPGPHLPQPAPLPGGVHGAGPGAGARPLPDPRR